MTDRLCILAEGMFASDNGKTGHGVIRYAPREVVAIIDSTEAGKVATDVVPYCARPVPIVATVAAAAALGATRILIGVAPAGGKLTPQYRACLAEAMAAGMDVEAGLHTVAEALNFFTLPPSSQVHRAWVSSCPKTYTHIGFGSSR